MSMHPDVQVPYDASAHFTERSTHAGCGTMREEDEAFVKQLSPRETWHAMGEGAFGRVARARLLGERVAVKEAVKASKADALWNEVEYLRDFPHPNVTRYLGHYSDRRHNLLVRPSAPLFSSPPRLAVTVLFRPCLAASRDGIPAQLPPQQRCRSRGRHSPRCLRCRPRPRLHAR